MYAQRTMISAAVLYSFFRLVFDQCGLLSSSPIRHHFLDLLAPLVFIPIVVNLGLAFGVPRRHSSISPLEVFCCWVVLAVFFEILAPAIWERSTSDPLDVVAYGIGALLFWGIQRGRTCKAC